MPIAAAIRHIAFEDLGSFAPLLARRGYETRYFEAGVDDLAAAESSDLLVILGGPIGVNDEASYPFLTAEMKIVERHMKAGKPVLGICLGAQIMAHVLGGRIYPAPVKEIGWKKITLTEDGKKSCLRHLGEAEPVLHWHGDTFDVPKGAFLLASTAEVPHQAFSVGASALALQFHPEAVMQRIEQWLIGHTCELSVNKCDVAQIREDTKCWGKSLMARNEAMFGEWLNGFSSQANSASSAAA